MKEHGTGSETPSSIWGEEPAAAWGTLAATTRGNEASNQFTTSRVESIPGDYRLFYEAFAMRLSGRRQRQYSLVRLSKLPKSSIGAAKLRRR